jgi:hypothetical protein
MRAISWRTVARLAACVGLVLTLLPLGARAAGGQSAARAAVGPTTPAGAARAAFSALEARDWRALAALVDPRALAEFREDFLQPLEQFDSTGERASALNPERELGPSFAGVRSLAALRALPATDLYARDMAGQWRFVGEAFVRSARVTRAVVGTVAEGDSTAHVVYRLRVARGTRRPNSVAQVITARRVAGAWRLVPNADLTYPLAAYYSDGRVVGAVGVQRPSRINR